MSLGKSDAPAAPDYVGAANATAAGNLDAARVAAKANRVNQYTPYGNLTYSHSGEDPDAGWTATQTLSPAQQSMLSQNNALSLGLLGTAQTGLGKVNDMLSQPAIDTSRLANMPTNPGESYMDAALRYLQPSQDRDKSQMETKLANQGIAAGTEAWHNAMGDLTDQQDRARLQAVMSGMDKNMTARQQGIQEQNYLNTYPLNIINALRTGNQVQNPNFVTVPQQATTAGPDLLGATNAQYNAQLGAVNAENAAAAGTMNGLFSLGSAAMGAPSGGWFSGLFR